MKRNRMKNRMAMLGRLMALCMLMGAAFMPYAPLSAQTSNPIVFSAVARDGDGFVRHNTTLNLDVRLVDRQSQAVVYNERHSLTTDAMGQVQIPLGEGTSKSGDFRTVDFSQGLDLVVYDGSELLTRSPLTQVPSAAYAEKADAAVTATNALSAETARVAETAQIAQSAETARVAETATSAQTAMSAKTAETAQVAQRAHVAEAVTGISFNDEGEPAANTIWSSAKVSRMIGGQTTQSGQTGLAKETAERKAEDASLKSGIDEMSTGLAKETAERKAEDGKLLDSIVKERNTRAAADALLKSDIDDLSTDLDSETTERKAEDERLSAGIDELESALADTAKVLWDTISELSAAIKSANADLSGRLDSMNHCMVNNAENGIYSAAIPLYSAEKPLEVGLFTEPLLKVLRQSNSSYLFTDLSQASALKKSYRCRVMTYNESGDAANPTEVYIPASTSDLSIYVDNVKIDENVTYYTYDALVFNVEYYYLGDGITPKMYVTLIRE